MEFLFKSFLIVALVEGAVINICLASMAIDLVNIRKLIEKYVERIKK